MKTKPDIESELNDLADMARVADMLMELFVHEMTGAARLGVSSVELVKHLEHWQSAASFAVLHNKEMAAALREKYLGC